MKNKLNELKNVLDAIRTCTEPISKHSDPKSVDDCWKAAFEFIDDIKNDQDKRDRLLVWRAEQFQREAEAQVFQMHNYTYGITVGMRRIIDLIKRHHENGNI